MAENTEATGLLAVIDTKIAALQRMRESVIAAISVGAFGQGESIDPSNLPPAPSGGISTPSFSQLNGSLDLPTGIFRDKGLADAIRLLLSAAKRKTPFKEIKAALLQGGLATTAEDFDPTLSGTLNRMKRTGELLAFKEGWDLASSYPESFRQRLAQSTEGTAKTKRKSTAKKKAKKIAEFKKSIEAATPAPKPAATKKPAASDKGHLAEIGEAVLRRA